MNTHPQLRGRGPRARFPAPAAWLLLAVLLAPAALAASGDVIHAYDLLPRVRGLVMEDGAVQLRLQSDSGPRLLLQVQLPLPATRRQAERGPRFTAVTTEGTPGGLRGFARQADDDDDGKVDEDPLDGRDNDGDGLIDEDFAAISDAMTVVDRQIAGRHLHLESYHWSYPHLRSDLLLDCRLDDGAGRDLPGTLVLELPEASWREAELAWCAHGVAREETARCSPLFAAAVEDPESETGWTWIGVSTLDAGATTAEPVGLPRLEKGRLELPFPAGGTALALGVAPTLLQLRYDLAAAQTVRRGARGRLGEGRVSWVVPPLCPVCRSGPVPAVRAEPADGRWDLVFDVKVGQNALLDPDRFAIDGLPLGPPRAIAWSGSVPDEEGGGEAAAAWSCEWSGPDRTLGRTGVAQDDPYGTCPALRQHAGAGELRFAFAGQPPLPAAGSDWELTGVLLSGRTFGRDVPAPLEEERAPAPVGEAAADSERNEAIRRGDRPPVLSPELLHNYPNPFRDQTRVHYRIPVTVGEAFVWEDGEAPRLDPASPVPYRSGQPLVSLKVYSIKGQEVATLYAGSLGAGDYEETWDGTDAHGRPVASGTYFCKLQIEDWAVTKRLVFLR